MFQKLKNLFKQPEPKCPPVIPEIMFNERKRLYHLLTSNGHYVINHVLLSERLEDCIHSLEYVAYGQTVLIRYPNEKILEIHESQFDKSPTNTKYQKQIAAMLGLDYLDWTRGKICKRVLVSK